MPNQNKPNNKTDRTAHCPSTVVSEENLEGGQFVKLKKPPKRVSWIFFRHKVIKIITSKWFDWFMIFTIIFSSASLGLTDYSHIDRNPASPSYGDPISKGSKRNSFSFRADIVFTIIFTAEMILKITGLGLIRGKNNAYFRDGWNVLDCIITLGSLIALLPRVPSLNMFRIFRLLRPLRTISRLPGLKKLINTMLSAIPQMMDVLLYLFVVLFVIFNIFGQSLFMGSMSAVCRLTPFPVKHEWALGMNYSQYRCLDAPNLDTLPSGRHKWTKASSPWAVPQECYWPTDDSDRQLCSLAGFQGKHRCVGTWCGSNYDYFGNPKFKGDAVIGMYQRYFTSQQLLDWPTFKPELNFGYTTFDNFLLAVVPLFQTATLTGWSDILFMIGDASNLAVPVIFFFFFILIGAFVVLNLVVAVLEQQFRASEDKHHIQQKIRRPSVYKNGCEHQRLSTTVIRGQALHSKRGLAYQLITSAWFNNFVTAVILLNTVVLASDHYPREPDFVSAYEEVNFACTVLFFTDMVLRICALGVVDYFHDQFYLFDSCLVVLSIVELGLGPPSFLTGKSGSHLAGISVLRTLRLLRFFKLVKQWKSMQDLFGKMLRSAFDMANFLGLLFLFVYIMSLVGVQFFSNIYRFDEFGFRVKISDPRWEDIAPSRLNFDSLIWAFFTVFAILTLEDWHKIMYDGWRATDHGASTMYFIITIIFGEIVLMNVFLAILLSNFTEASSESPSKNPDVPCQAPKEEVSNSQLEDTVQYLDRAVKALVADPEGANQIESETAIFPLRNERTLLLFGPTTCIRRFCVSIITSPLFDYFIMVVILISSVALAIDGPLIDPQSSLKKGLVVLDYLCAAIFILESSLKIVSLGLYFQPRAYLKCHWNLLDFFVVVVSIVGISAQRAGGKIKSLRSLRALRAFRPLRMIKQVPSMKVVVDTLFSSVPAVMNVVAVALFFLLVFGAIGLSILKGTLRYCSLGTEDSPGSLYDPLSLRPNLFGQLLVAPRSWALLSSTEKDWFGPASPFNATKSENGCEAWPDTPCCSSWPKNIFSVPTSRQVCECWGASWGIWTGQFLFDNIGQSMLSFYTISSLAGWVSLTLESIDQRGINMQPVRNYNVTAMMFLYVSFVLVVHYVVMNLTVGVIVEVYKKQGSGGEFILLTDKQQVFAKTMKVLRRVKLSKNNSPPRNHIGKMCFQLVHHPAFEQFVMAVIVVNMLLLALQHKGQSELFTLFFNVADYAFCLFFTLEALIKICALEQSYFHGGWTRYFLEGWNRFDFCVVVVTDLCILLELTGGISQTRISTVARTFRVGRIVRLVRHAESVHRLFTTLISTLLGLFNICGVWFLLLYIFAILANQQYATTAFNGSYNENLNFQTFSRSLLTLLVFSIGDKWDGFMMDASSKTPGCVASPPYNPSMCGFSNSPSCVPLNGCGQQSLILFLCIFQFLVGTVMLNLFIGIIVGELAAQNSREDVINEHDFKIFSDHWALYDTQATYFIGSRWLEKFLTTIPPPWNVCLGLSSDEICDKIESWSLKVYREQFVHFYDLFGCLAVEAMALKLNPAEQLKRHVFKLSLQHTIKDFKSRKFSETAFHNQRQISRQDLTRPKLLATLTRQQVIRKNLVIETKVYPLDLCLKT